MVIIYDNVEEVKELNRIIENGLLNMKTEDILKLNYIVKNGKISISCIENEKDKENR